MKQTIEIEVPDGKKVAWEDGKVVFKDAKPLPKTWDEYVKYYLSDEPSCLRVACIMDIPNYIVYRHTALIQLHRLRDCYRQGWVRNRDDYDHNSWCIKYCHAIGLCISPNPYDSRFLSFPTQKLANEFLNNFRDLIEQAGDLI